MPLSPLFHNMPHHKSISTFPSSARTYHYSNCIAYIIALFGLLLLSQLAWQQSDNSSIESLPETRLQQEELLGPTNTSSCSIQDFNQGEWKHKPVKLKKQGDIAAFEDAVGYYCPASFHHRCYERGGQELDRSKRM